MSVKSGVYVFVHYTAWREWCPLDTSLGAWLLDPDNPANSFSELLARHGMQQLAPPPPEAAARERGGGVSPATVRQDLALLGPLMVKIYQKLQVMAVALLCSYLAIPSLQSNGLLPVFLEIETKLIPILAGNNLSVLVIVGCTFHREMTYTCTQ